MTPDYFDAEAFQIQNDITPQGVLRCVKARRFRQEGMTDAQVAEMVGIPERLVPVAVQTAEERHPPVSSEDVAQMAFFLHSQQIVRLQERAIAPGFKHDVKGELMLGPDGQPEIDTATQIQAEREISRNVEALRKLVGTDAPVKRHLSIEEVRRRGQGLELLEALETPAAIAAVDVVDGEVIYDPGGPSLTLGDGGLLGEERTDGE